MQTVSQQFKDTALSGEITPVREVRLTLLDNVSIGAELTPSAATIDSTVVGPTKATNGRTKAGRRWAAADHFDTVAAGARNVPKNDGDPNAIYPIDIASEGGWWGSTVSDASGNIGGGGEIFTLTYARPLSIFTITWHGDSFLGLPVNFSVDYDPTGSAGWTNIATVLNYADTSWIYTFSAATFVAKIRMTITKVSLPFIVAKLMEFEGGLTLDVTNSVGRLSILSERQADSATLQVGNTSANQLNLSIDNTQGHFSPNNANSPYRTYLKSNRKVTVRSGFKYVDGTTELVPLGTYYSMAWDAPGGGTLVSIRAQDRMKRLRERKYRTCPLHINKTVDTIIRQTLLDAGLGVSDFILAATTSTVPYAWCTPTQSFFEFITQLVAAVGGVVYFDQNDIFHFEDADFLNKNRSVSVITLTDNNAVISANDNYDEGQVKNRVSVGVNTQKLLASAQIWSLQEVLTVPAGFTLTINVAFSGPSTNVAAPVITGGADIVQQSWTVYATSAVLIVKNNGNADETITAITVAGQALQADGANIILAEDSELVATDGPRDLSISNSFIQSREPAASVAYTLLNLQKNPPSRLQIEAAGLPHLELGDRIKVQSTILGIDADYWLIRHNFNDDGGLRSSLDVTAVPGELPTQATLWHRSAIVTAGSALADGSDDAQPYRFYAYQNPAADGDTTTNSFFLRAGSYTMYILGRSGVLSGQVDLYIDNVFVLKHDWYSSGEAVVTRVVPGVVIPTDGYHTIKLIINGKNAASVGYALQLTKIWFKPANNPYNLDLTGVASTALPTRSTRWHRDAIVLTGGAITTAIDAAQRYSHYVTQAGAANGDSFTQGMFLRAGTYTFSVLGLIHNLYGKLDWYIDNVVVVSGQDWYTAAGPIYNTVQTASVVVATDGYHTLKAVVNGKNAASAGYTVPLTKYWFRQAAD